MSFDALPHEVVELIIDSISDNPDGYRSYSLVSRGWFKRCRYHAFGSITLLANRHHPLPKNIARGISPFVRELLVTQSAYQGIENDEVPSWIHIPLLTRLERVTVNNQNCGFRHMLDLFRYLYLAIRGNLPILTIAHTGNILIGMAPFNDVVLLLREASEVYLTNFYRHFDQAESDPAHAPSQMKHLTLKALFYQSLHLPAKIILAGPNRLQSLMINVISPLWQEVLYNLGPSLEHFVKLSTKMFRSGTNEEPNVVPDLSANTNLKTIGYQEPVYSQPSEPTLAYTHFLMQMLSNVSRTLTFTLLIDSNETFNERPDYQSMIEHLARVRPSITMQLYHQDLDHKFGVELRDWFPELYRAERIKYRSKSLEQHTYSDLQQYVT